MRLKEACCGVLSNLEVLALLRTQEKNLLPLASFLQQQERPQKKQPQEGAGTATGVQLQPQQQEEGRGMQDDCAAAPLGGVSAERLVAMAAAAAEGAWPSTGGSPAVAEAFHLCVQKHLLSYTVQRHICSTCRYAQHVPFDFPAAGESRLRAAASAAEEEEAAAAGAPQARGRRRGGTVETEEHDEKRADLYTDEPCSTPLLEPQQSSSSSRLVTQRRRSHSNSNSSSPHPDTSGAGSSCSSGKCWTAGEEGREDGGSTVAEEQLLGGKYGICIRRCLDVLLQQFGLYQAELLQILNLAPLKPVEIYAIVDDCASRLSEAAVGDLLEVLRHYLDEANPVALPGFCPCTNAVPETAAGAEGADTSAGAAAAAATRVDGSVRTADAAGAGAAPTGEKGSAALTDGAAGGTGTQLGEHVRCEAAGLANISAEEEEGNETVVRGDGRGRSARGGTRGRRRGGGAAAAPAGTAPAAGGSRRQRSARTKKNAQLGGVGGGDAAEPAAAAAVADAAAAVGPGPEEAFFFDSFFGVSAIAAPETSHNPSQTAAAATAAPDAAVDSADALAVLFAADPSDQQQLSDQDRQWQPQEAGGQQQHSNQQWDAEDGDWHSGKVETLRLRGGNSRSRGASRQKGQGSAAAVGVAVLSRACAAAATADTSRRRPPARGRGQRGNP